jgi:hypothetical protein
MADIKPKSDVETLAALKAEKAAIEATGEIEKLKGEILAMKAGAKGPQHLANLQKRAAIRDATHKDGNEAIYQLSEPAFLGGVLLPQGTIVRWHVDKMPGASWLPVEKTAAPALVAAKK